MLFSRMLIASMAVLCSFSVKCQTFDANSKLTGKLVIAGDTFEGTLDVNLELNQVLFSKDNQMKIYSASQLDQILLNDHPAFVSASIQKTHYLFEILTHGQITLLYKEGITDEFTNKVLDPYFVQTPNGLKELTRKKDFLALFGNDEKWMELHIKNNDLDLDIKEDIITAFGYYNQTFEATSPSP